MKRTRLRPKSAKRRTADIARTELRWNLLSDPAAKCAVTGCRNQPTLLHEPLRRSQGGDPTDPNDVMTVCNPCHLRIHDQPAWAYEHGYLIRRWSL